MFFLSAKAVFHPNPIDKDSAVAQYGFYRAIGIPSADQVIIRITARNIYRLYVNGELVMHGPARTAHGYCRVDEADISDWLMEGVNHIAVEVMAYNKNWAPYNGYSNDCTLEDGLFIAEIEADGKILTATGRDEWQVCSITARVPVAERISHCRECMEIYRLDDAYHLWRLGVGDFLPVTVAVLNTEPNYLLHKSMRATMNPYPFEELVCFGATKIDSDIQPEPFFFEANNPLLSSLSEHPTMDCRRTVDNPNGSLNAEHGTDCLTLTPYNTEDYFAIWDGVESRVGFIRISVICERAGIIDIVRSEIIAPDGRCPYPFNNVTRLHVPAGLTEFVTMEPGLARYLTLHFRGVGRVTVLDLSILDYAYPDEKRAVFQCSNDNVNCLYRAAKKTLLLNTQDVFMDCPDRERGGWLCDSLWTARAASLMLSDHRVEREMLENFLLTPAEGMGHAYFPEVYPANKPSFDGMPGISTWSFWLMCELCEFIRRTGDTEFGTRYKPRVEAFIRGTHDFIGKHGLLENMPFIFVDWSLANQTEYTSPISTAANALYAYLLIELGRVFDEPSWIEAGRAVRDTLRRAIVGNRSADTLKHIPDSFTVAEDGTLHSRGKFSEAAMYTALWAELFTPEEAPVLYQTVRDCMGPAPVFGKDPNVGESQLFIGLCIRLDLLARMGAYDKMYEDLLAIYEPQLREGPGTLWETTGIDTSSRCHGFTSHAGVHLMRDVLGMGDLYLHEDGIGKPCIEIAPHICGLRWARGCRETPAGMVGVEWTYDGESFMLRVNVSADYECRITLPREVRMLDQDKVSVRVYKY